MCTCVFVYVSARVRCSVCVWHVYAHLYADAHVHLCPCASVCAYVCVRTVELFPRHMSAAFGAPNSLRDVASDRFLSWCYSKLLFGCACCVRSRMHVCPIQIF